MESFSIDKIPPSGFFSKPLFLDDGFILSAPEMAISPDLIKAVSEWGFSKVFSDGEICENYAPQEVNAQDTANEDTVPAGDFDKVQQAQKFYLGFMRFVKTLYSQIPYKDVFDYAELTEQIKHICGYVKENRLYIMRAQQQMDHSPDEDYLFSHIAHSTMIAIIIGTYLKFPNHRLIELAIAALLHEIGMIKIPQDSYISGRSLTDDEKKLIFTHPVLGYKMLRLSNFPLGVSLAVLEHHERENGTGYPQKLTGDKIGLYSKIIAVACSYDAISAKRPYKEAKDGYTSITELLKNEGKQYNDTIIKALVYSISIYPIGMYVFLSNEKKGQVIDLNPEFPQFPIVHIIGQFQPDGHNIKIQTSQEGVSIIRPLTPEEIQG